LSEITYRMRDIRTMFVAANNLAPRFSAEVNYYLEGMRPFGPTIESPDDFSSIRFSSEEREVPAAGSANTVSRRPQTNSAIAGRALGRVYCDD